MVVVYPEGTLTRDPDLWPMRGKTGAVRIALEHDIPIIPAAHWGTQALLPRYGKKLSLFPRKTIDVAHRRAGRPQRVPRQAARPGDPAEGDRRAHGRDHRAARRAPRRAGAARALGSRRRTARRRRVDSMARTPAPEGPRQTRRRARCRQLGHHVREDPRRRRRRRRHLGASARARARDPGGEAQQRLPPRHQPAARAARDEPARPRARRRRAGLRLGAEPVAAREPAGRAARTSTPRRSSCRS